MDIDTTAQANAPPPIQKFTRTGRPQRNYRQPKRFEDFLPESSLPGLEAESDLGPIQRVLLIVRDRLVTAANSFGMWRDYPRRPTRDPDAFLSLKDLAANSSQNIQSPHPILQETANSNNQPYRPFANSTIHRVMQWLNNGNTVKSEAQLNEFVNKVILSPDFEKEHLTGFDAHRENLRLDNALEQMPFYAQFNQSTVAISVPSGSVNTPPKPFMVPGLLHRKLTEVISHAFRGPLSHLFHFSPFKLYHHSSITKKDERIYGEIYTSDAFLEEHEIVQRRSQLPPDDLTCKREKVVAALMFSSDATHLTTFGNAKAWPIYLMLGNLSKYIRSQPNSGAMHHLAYIPSVSQSVYI